MKYIAKTLYGLEQILANELKELGAVNVKPVNRAVIFEGDKYLLYKVNYFSRIALSVLKQIAEFRIRSADELYKSSINIRWEEFMDVGQTFSVVPVIHSPLFDHSGYAGLLLKDAVADWFRRKTGKRPSVNSDNPDIVFNLHVSNNQAAVSVDSSVIPLFKRGYRKEQGLAPMNEVLAAGIVMLSGWDGRAPILDPMCGSGTLPVEAALYACGIPPGRFRNFFGFQRWNDYDEVLFNQIKDESNAKVVNPDVRISCSDISQDAVNIARRNIESAGLSEVIKVQQADFRDLKGDGNGFVLMNPPYGERLKQVDAEGLYSMVGTTLKHGFAGYKALLITSDKDSLKYIGLKPSKRITLFNGSLECVLVKYELYEGSNKKRYNG